MRVLVVGTVPPPGGELARALGLEAARLVAAGHDVEVLSPDSRAAAHRHASLGGPLLALRLAMAAPRFDALVLRVERGLPFGEESGRGARAATLIALGAALRLWKDVTIRLDTPVPIPGGLGGRASRGLWARASGIVVWNDDDRDQLLGAPGVVAERVTVAPPASHERSAPAAGWAVETDDRLRESVLTLVRERARADRRVETARAELAGTGVPGGGSPFSSGPAATRRGISATGVARLVARRARRVVASRSGRG
ncbi:MAG TPA: hypothetical protein VMU75_05675 [Acidimicrobiales bacterium]|nr:hypothetical protein [Acidimicrobiales bacterium]